MNTSSGTTFESNATYTCNAGYMRFGLEASTCEANGLWSSTEPTCDRTFILLLQQTWSIIVYTLKLLTALLLLILTMDMWTQQMEQPLGEQLPTPVTLATI